MGPLWATLGARVAKRDATWDSAGEKLTPFSPFSAQFHKQTRLCCTLFPGPVFSSILSSFGRARPSPSTAPVSKINVSALRPGSFKKAQFWRCFRDLEAPCLCFFLFFGCLHFACFSRGPERARAGPRGGGESGFGIPKRRLSETRGLEAKRQRLKM